MFRFSVCAALLILSIGCREAADVQATPQAGTGPRSPAAAPVQSAVESELAGRASEQVAEKDMVDGSGPLADPVAGNTSQPVNPPSTVDVSAFMDDALNGKISSVRQAIAAGVDVNAQDEQGRTALLLAAFNGHTGIVQILLDHGADLQKCDGLGRTALMFASTGDNAKAVAMLLAAGAEVNAVDSGEGFTALMHAAAEGQLEVVKSLLQHAADPTIRDVDGDTARDFASRNGHQAVVDILPE